MKNNSKKLPLVLVVDDNQRNLQLVGDILMSEDCEISLARSGKEALAFVHSYLPDLILLDIMMPQTNGYETCIQLKANEKTKGIPVIFLTARSEPEDVVKGFEHGAVDYITKPFEPLELISRVRTHLDLGEKNKALMQSNMERKQLLHILCHDLANPLSAIEMILQVVEKEPLIIQELLTSLKNTVNNGLDLKALVRQMMVLERQKLPLIHIFLSIALAESLAILKVLYEKKNIEIEVHVDLQIKILAEKVSLVNSVLNNLLTNAIKFSYPNGKIIIEAEVANQQVVMSIRDFGLGMTADIRKNVFDVEQQISRPGTKGEKGTGFGLLLVKKFLDIYDAKIVIQSVSEEEDNKNHGTTIQVFFQMG